MSQANNKSIKKAQKQTRNSFLMGILLKKEHSLGNYNSHLGNKGFDAQLNGTGGSSIGPFMNLRN